MASVSGWSELHSDLLVEISDRLDMPGFFRFGAVCTSWHSSTINSSQLQLRRLLCKDSEQPWLILSSPNTPETRHFYSLTEQKSLPIRLPDIAGHQFIGSSHGYLISLDHNADIHATNPLTGAHLPLPPTSTFPSIAGALRRPVTRHVVAYLRVYTYTDRNRGVYFEPIREIRQDFFTKVILSPSLDFVVAIHARDTSVVAFARPGDAKWTKLCSVMDHDYRNFNWFHDAIFHKGLLYIVSNGGKMMIFDLQSPSAPFRLSYVRAPEVGLRASMRWHLAAFTTYSNSLLFLVGKDVKCTDRGTKRIVGVKVFHVNENRDPYRLLPMDNLRDSVFVLGLNYSLMLHAADHPCFKGNHAYFTEDDNVWLKRQPEDRIDSLGVDVFHFDGSRSKEPFYSKNDLDSLSWPSPLWFVPSLK